MTDKLLCPCCSGKDYSLCCAPYVEGSTAAPTAESLMRSRYTAYSRANINYIEKTMRGPAAKGFDHQASYTWAQNLEWLGLTVLSTSEHHVEFYARMRENGKPVFLHEISTFELIDAHWYYVDGRPGKKLQPNKPCPCGSGLKFKKCCGGHHA